MGRESITADNAMEPIIPEAVNSYLESLLPSRSPLLVRLEQEAAEVDFPIVGPLVGAYLRQLARLIKARNILELGSGFGYSALWLGEALPEDGTITCTERNPQNVERMRRSFEKAGLSAKLRVHQGDALEIANNLTGSYDVVFNDVDKQQYPATIPIVKRLLVPGGLFITDNVLWSGRIAAPEPDENTRAIVRFSRELYADPAFDCSVVPLRDGLLVAAYKLG